MTNVIVTVSWCINIVGSQSNLPWFSVCRCRCPARLPANKSIMASHLTHPLRCLLGTRRGKVYPRHGLGHQLEQILTLETARGRKKEWTTSWFICSGDEIIRCVFINYLSTKGIKWFSRTGTHININICFECRPFRLNIQRRGRGGCNNAWRCHGNRPALRHCPQWIAAAWKTCPLY